MAPATHGPKQNGRRFTGAVVTKAWPSSLLSFGLASFAAPSLGLALL